jgi:hypothetical protein
MSDNVDFKLTLEDDEKDNKEIPKTKELRHDKAEGE